jgi:hypothetical protein
MAGFEVTFYGRIWVTPKDLEKESERKVLKPSRPIQSI